MNNPFITFITTRGTEVRLNVTRIASIEKQRYENSDEFCTHVVVAGGGGAFVACHHLRAQYDEICAMIDAWYDMVV